MKQLFVYYKLFDHYICVVIIIVIYIYTIHDLHKFKLFYIRNFFGSVVFFFRSFSSNFMYVFEIVILMWFFSNWRKYCTL